MKKVLIIFAVLTVAAVIFIPISSNYRRDLGWVDSISGSRKSQTVWQSGKETTPVIVDSPLAEKYRELGLIWQPDWKNIRGTSYDVFGRVTGHGHGSAPEIYPLEFGLQKLFIAASSDDEIRIFFRIMSSDSETDRKAAVDCACQKALEHSSGTQPSK